MAKEGLTVGGEGRVEGEDKRTLEEAFEFDLS